ncbi:unnamed protein product, partial [Discosporangium mesarthrocarpum]
MVDVSDLQGYLMKEKSKTGLLNGLTGDSNKRYFKVQKIEGGEEWALCYYKNRLDNGIRGWIYLRDLKEISEDGDIMKFASAARTLFLSAQTRAEHRLWIVGIAKLCPYAFIRLERNAHLLEPKDSPQTLARGKTRSIDPAFEDEPQQSIPSLGDVDELSQEGEQGREIEGINRNLRKVSSRGWFGEREEFSHGNADWCGDRDMDHERGRVKGSKQARSGQVRDQHRWRDTDRDKDRCRDKDRRRLCNDERCAFKKRGRDIGRQKHGGKGDDFGDGRESTPWGQESDFTNGGGGIDDVQESSSHRERESGSRQGNMAKGGNRNDASPVEGGEGSGNRRQTRGKDPCRTHGLKAEEENTDRKVWESSHPETVYSSMQQPPAQDRGRNKKSREEGDTCNGEDASTNRMEEGPPFGRGRQPEIDVDPGGSNQDEEVEMEEIKSPAAILYPGSVGGYRQGVSATSRLHRHISNGNATALGKTDLPPWPKAFLVDSSPELEALSGGSDPPSSKAIGQRRRRSAADLDWDDGRGTPRGNGEVDQLTLAVLKEPINLGESDVEEGEESLDFKVEKQRRIAGAAVLGLEASAKGEADK